jgi:hypothetical protein
MKDKESNIILDMDNVEIEYNEDFDSNKTKSLIKFPNKNKEFNIDNPSKNFSKSLNFNSRQCYAPKIKYKKNKKRPSPIFFKKIQNEFTMKRQCDAISEDLLSEKESSLSDDSSSSEYSLNNIEEENNNQNNEKNENDKGNIKKIYEHKTIAVFPHQGNKDKQNKNSIKIFRNNLHKIKMKYSQIKNKEQEFTLKNKFKKKFKLDLILNNKKNIINNEYIVIPINNNENTKSDSEDDSGDVSKLRGTISYNQSKLKKDKENKKESHQVINIYEVLRKSVK